MQEKQVFKDGILYRMDATLFSKVRYIKESTEIAAFIIPEEMINELPNECYLIPDGEDYTFSPFHFTLSQERTLYQPDEESSALYYLVHGLTKDVADDRDDLRVLTSFQIKVFCPAAEGSVTVTVKNISAGGMFFVSDQPFEPGWNFSFVLANSGNPTLLPVQIIKKLPVRQEGLTGFGCRFVRLSEKQESEVRKYVFQQEHLQRRRRTF